MRAIFSRLANRLGTREILTGDFRKLYAHLIGGMLTCGLYVTLGDVFGRSYRLKGVGRLVFWGF